LPAEFFTKGLDKPILLVYTDISEKYKYPENYDTQGGKEYMVKKDGSESCC
jgi:hypothetical protein